MTIQAEKEWNKDRDDWRWRDFKKKNEKVIWKAKKILSKNIEPLSWLFGKWKLKLRANERKNARFEYELQILRRKWK